MRRPGLLLICLGLLLITGCDRGERTLRQAEEAERAGHLDEAERLLLELVETDADRASQALYRAALIRADGRGDPEGGLELLVRLLSEHGDTREAGPASEKAGDLLFGVLRDPSAATVAYGRCVDLAREPGRRERCGVALVRAFLLQGEVDQAAEELELMVAARGDEEPSLTWLLLSAQIQELRGEDEAALVAFRDLQQRFPLTEEAQVAAFSEASLVEKAGDLEDALELFRGLRERYPSPRVVDVRISSLEQRIERRDRDGRPD